MDRKEFIDNYGPVLVKFIGYYKYVFTFKAELPDTSIVRVSVGGNADDIYRFEVSSEELSSVESLDPYSGSVYKNGKEVCSFYEP